MHRNNGTCGHGWTRSVIGLAAIVLMLLSVAASAQTVALTPNQQTFVDAHAAFKDGKRAQADRGFAKLSSDAVLGELADWMRLRIAYQDKAYKRALPLCDRLLARDLDIRRDYTVRMHRALALRRSGQSSASVAEYLDIARRHPGQSPDKVLLRLGSAYEAGGLYRRAERAWQKVVWLYPRSAHRKSALKEIRRLRAARKLKMAEPDVDLLHETISTYEKTSRHKDTTLYAEKFLRLYPRDPRAATVRLILADTYVRRDLHDRARQTLLSATRPQKDQKAWIARRAYLVARSTGAVTGDDKDDVRRALLAYADRFPKSRWATRALELVGYSYWADERFGRAALYYQRAFESPEDIGRSDLHGWRAGWGRYQDGDFGRSAASFEAEPERPEPSILRPTRDLNR